MAWFERVGPFAQKMATLEIVVCPPVIYLLPLFQLVTKNHYRLILGVQDVSQFEEGPFTGEVSATQISPFAQYAIIGHSERRQYFSESPSIVAKKAALALRFGLKPIICLNADQVAELGVFVKKPVVAAYEPPGAISTNPEAVAEDWRRANQVCQSFLAVLQKGRAIYGGSVDFNNVSQYLRQPAISGVLVGKASLEAEGFIRLLESADS